MLSFFAAILTANWIREHFTGILIAIGIIIFLIVYHFVKRSRARAAAAAAAAERERRVREILPASDPEPSVSSSYDAEDVPSFEVLDLSSWLFGGDPFSFVAFDLETTGLSPTDDAIIEIGAVRVSDCQVVDTFHQLVDPGRPINARASAVNHITDDMLIGAPSINEVLPDFLEFVGDDVLVAHNARFDAKFLTMACWRCGLEAPGKYFDTMRLSYYWPDLPDKKLATMLSAAGVENTEAHRALSDAEALAQLMIVAMNKDFNLPLPNDYTPSYSTARFSGIQEPVDATLAKKRFVLTGKPGDYERPEFERMILSHGGKVTNQISNATDYLVRGSFPGLPRTYVSAAVVFARKMIEDGGKVRIVSPDDVLRMMEAS